MIDFEKLKEEQIKLANKVILTDSTKKIKTIGGADRAYTGDKIISSIVVCDYKNFEVVDKKYAIADAKIPYKSGFLFYKDGPAVLEAFSMLKQKPDMLIVEGNGILHPRRIGLASHVGILSDTPTIGITKRLMLGQVRERTIYVDKEARGYEIVTREHSNPIYISPGHKVSLNSSLEIIKNCMRFPHKLPEPLHLAHKYANKIRDELVKN